MRLRAYTPDMRVTELSRTLHALTVTCEQHQARGASMDATTQGKPGAAVYFDWEEPTKTTKKTMEEEEDVRYEVVYPYDMAQAGEATMETETESLRRSTRELMAKLNAPVKTVVYEEERPTRIDHKALPVREENQENPRFSQSYMTISRQTVSASRLMELPLHRRGCDPPTRRLQTTSARRRHRAAGGVTSRSYDVHAPSTPSVVPFWSADPPPVPPQSTYRENYQWPTREELTRVIEKVDGYTAGGEARYQPIRAFTASEAFVVAKEAARDFLRKDDEASVVLPPSVVPEPPSVNQVQEVERHVETVQEGETKKIQDEKRVNAVDSSVMAIVPEAPPREDFTQTNQIEPLKEKEPLVYKRRRPSPPKPPSTPTEQPQELSVKSTYSFSRVSKSASLSLRESQLRARRSRQAQSINPILVNARYPLEPLVFRAKSTYSIEYGQRSVSRR